MTWSEHFTNYAFMIAGMYLKDKAAVLQDLQWGSVVECLNESYQVMVKDKSMIPIEELPTEKKTEIWDMAKNISTEKRHRILVSKAIYMLDKITENL